MDYNYVPRREKDGGPIINWIADRLNYLGCWLVDKTSRYALFYEVNGIFDELDDETNTDAN